MQKSMIDIFVHETNGFLGNLEALLMRAESNGDEIVQSVPEIFRIMHTIKSSAAMMSFDTTAKLAHAVEDLFYFIREHNPKNVDKSRLADIVLESVDYIKKNLIDEFPDDPAEIIDKGKRYLDELKAMPSDANALPVNNYALRIMFKPDCRMISMRAFEIETKLMRVVKSVKAVPGIDDKENVEQLKSNGLLLQIESEQPPEEIIKSISTSPFVSSVALEGETSKPSPQPEKPAAEVKPDVQPEDRKVTFRERSLGDRRTATGVIADGLVSVSMDKIDQLIDMSGELIIAQSSLSHAVENGQYDQVNQSIAEMGKLILQTQQAALSIRMFPMRETLQKLNRGLRDMARKQGKEIQYVIHGEETEVDKNVADSIYMPLVHIVRNAVDHGIEQPDIRERAGKPRVGKIEVSAVSRDNDVYVTVADDGAGLNRPKIIETAISRGVIVPDQITLLSEQQIDQLIFTPGFSTSDEVTEFSGRGVGMDVVNDTIKKLGGKVTVSSVEGYGTMVELQLPMTITVRDAMILRAGSDHCAVSITQIVEMFRISDCTVDQVNGQDTVLLRGRCYPVMRLCDFFGHDRDWGYDESGIMIIVSASTEDYVLYVDEVVGNQSIVVKRLPKLLDSVKGIYGCTILGDGTIGLILNLNGLRGVKR